MVYYTEYQSPMGQLLLTSDGEHLTGLGMDCPAPREAEKADALPVLQQTVCWLDAYFRGENPPVTVPVAASGSAFQQRVWQRLREIPYGKAITYGDIAREMEAQTGKRMSAQAVGGAVGSNPISILVPCHRVVGAGGKLTGYEWGLERKAWLLRHEKWEGVEKHDHQ